MDPNATLAVILKIADVIKNNPNASPEVDEMATAILDLDDWLANAGFLPERWRSI